MALSEQYNKDLSGMNTFRMNVSCSRFIEYDSLSDLMDIDPEDLPHPIRHIGGGSNLLFTDDFKGTILHSKIGFIEPVAPDGTDDEEEISLEDIEGDEVLVSVGSGVIFDDLCGWAADNGLWGLENLSDIPGETGAAAVQNIGAYGTEFKDVVEKVYCYDLEECELLGFSNEECGYGYRQSIFKTPEYRNLIVTHVVIRLKRKPSPKLDYGHLRESVEQAPGYSAEQLDPAFVRKVIKKIRGGKLPDPKEIGSAGSFFKNPIVTKEKFAAIEAVARKDNGADYKVPHYIVPAVKDGIQTGTSTGTEEGDTMVKVPAAWMIEQCGWKGRRSGNAAVYDKQPLVIVNLTGQASPDEIVALEHKVIASVKARYGVTLEPEVEHLP